MLDNEIKPNISNEKDKKVVDDLMDELENIQTKIKSDKTIKRDDDDEHKKRKNIIVIIHLIQNMIEKNLGIIFILIFCSFSKLFSLNFSHKDRKRRRHSSTGSHSSNRSSGLSDRTPSPKHHHSSKKSRNHDRNESPPRRKGTSSIPDKPIIGSIYDGTVISIMQFGCFVRLDQFRNRTEGLVHISNVNIYFVFI